MVALARPLAPTRQDFERRDGSDWLRWFELTAGTNGTVTVTRIDGDEPDARSYKLAALRRFVLDGKDDPDLRADLRSFCRGLMPSSGRLALLILAEAGKAKAAAKAAA